MSGRKTCGDNCQRDAVAQIAEWGFPVREDSDRPGFSAYFLYAWKKKASKAALGEVSGNAGIRRLKRELARVGPMPGADVHRPTADASERARRHDFPQQYEKLAAETCRAQAPDLQWIEG